MYTDMGVLNDAIEPRKEFLSLKENFHSEESLKKIDSQNKDIF